MFLVTGTPDSIYYQSNYSTGVKRIEPGIHGLSNELLNSPWPKVDAGKEMLSELLRNDASPEELLDAMYNDHRFPDNQLPDTGVGIERERMLSSMFIKSPEYGSRCTTLIKIDRGGTVAFWERTYDLSNFQYNTVEFSFDLET